MFLKEIHNALASEGGYSIVKRILNRLVSDNIILPEVNGKARKYTVSPGFELFSPIDINLYFEKEIDKRKIKEYYIPILISEILSKINLFSNEEIMMLERLQTKFKKNISELSDSEYFKELERLAIDLSWKSSQIEGNTYSLLETERLLKEKETVHGKTKDEAIMLLNHKDALDFIISEPDYLETFTIYRIEDVHSLLVKELVIDRNIPRRKVGITGTNYKPIDN
jgi:hypothetical protein